MIRTYDVVDVTTFEPTGKKVKLDLDDDVRLFTLTVTVDELASRSAVVRAIGKSRDLEASAEAAAYNGEFASGDRPRKGPVHKRRYKG